MTNSKNTPLTVTEDRLIGAFRRFGEFGPVYEVIGPATQPDQQRMRIRVLLTGEEVDYRVSEILSDPED